MGGALKGPPYAVFAEFSRLAGEFLAYVMRIASVRTGAGGRCGVLGRDLCGGWRWLKGVREITNPMFPYILLPSKIDFVA